MTAAEFISSGILESYVMGLATPEEEQLVSKMTAQFPEVRAELDAIEKSLETLAQKNAVKPKPDTLDKIMKAIEAKPDVVYYEPKILPIRKDEKVMTPQPSFSWMAVAASVALLISISINLFLFSKLKTVREDLAQLTEEKNAFASELKIQQASYGNLEHDMNMMMMPTTSKVMLQGLEKSPTALAVVYWNTETKDVMLNIQQLPDAPSEMQYQLWAIVDGKPVDAGMIDMSSGGMHKMKSIDGKAVAFAVTLEKRGGSPVPTMDQMYLMGKV